MSGSTLRERLASGDPVLGATCGTTPAAAEILSHSGFDFVVLDTQHGHATVAGLLPFIQSIELGPAFPVVRVPWPEPAAIMRALDLGAHGVVVPLVNTPEQARLVASCCRYPPAGTRSMGQLHGSIRGVEAANREIACIVMVETAEALGHLDAIAATPGVDAILVGPADLSLSLGVPLGTATTDERLLTALDRVAEACVRHGLAPGWWLAGQEATTAGLRHGLRLFIPGSDLGHVRTGAAADAQALRTLAEATLRR